MGQTSDGTGTGGPSGPSGRVEWYGLPSPALVRVAGGLLSAALAAALGAFVLGEYEFEGWLPLGAGALFGLVIAEVAVSVGKRRTAGVALTCAALAGAGLLGAGLISAGAGEIEAGVWVAIAIGAALAALRVVGLPWRQR